MVSDLLSRQVWGSSGQYLPASVSGPQAGAPGHSPWRSRPSPGPCLLTGAHPHGLLLQDQKIPALPGGEQAGTVHAPGAKGEPDHGGGEEQAPRPGQAADSPRPSSLLTQHLPGASRRPELLQELGHGSRRGSPRPPSLAGQEAFVRLFISRSFNSWSSVGPGIEQVSDLSAFCCRTDRLQVGAPVMLICFAPGSSDGWAPLTDSLCDLSWGGGRWGQADWVFLRLPPLHVQRRPEGTQPMKMEQLGLPGHCRRCSPGLSCPLASRGHSVTSLVPRAPSSLGHPEPLQRDQAEATPVLRPPPQGQAGSLSSHQKGVSKARPRGKDRS